MLAVAVHEHDRAAAGVVEAGHQRRFLAEIARQRDHLDVERVGLQAARDRERRVGAAVVDIDDLAGQVEALPQVVREIAEALVQEREPGRLVIDGDDDRQPLRRGTRPRWWTGSKRRSPASSIKLSTFAP